MKNFAFAAAVFVATLPAAATAAPPQPAAPAVQPVTEVPATCPTIPDNSAISPATQRLFTTITDACLLKASGLIDDSQFATIRDQAVGALMTQMQMDDAQMQADANARLAKSLAVNP
ncbi:MAG: hypothetical protein WDN06_09355 [Asticcacaulis sp.]